MIRQLLCIYVNIYLTNLQYFPDKKLQLGPLGPREHLADGCSRLSDEGLVFYWASMSVTLPNTGSNEDVVKLKA